MLGRWHPLYWQTLWQSDRTRWKEEPAEIILSVDPPLQSRLTHTSTAMKSIEMNCSPDCGVLNSDYFSLTAEMITVQLFGATWLCGIVFSVHLNQTIKPDFGFTALTCHASGLSTDFRTQRPDIPNTAVYWQQGGTNTDGGRVAVLWRHRGSEWMAEPQRWVHTLHITHHLLHELHCDITLSWLLFLHRQKQWIQDQPALPMLHICTIK